MRPEEKQIAYVLTDLGFGDCGKGTTTHWLSRYKHAHTVIRTGGPQALHNVLTSTGKQFGFSQFGSASLRGSVTHLSRHMLIDPYRLLEEGRNLRDEHAIRDIFDRITINENCLAITPWQAIANRLLELARQNRQTSVGVGVGETVRDSEILGVDALFARDFGNNYLAEKLANIRVLKLQQLEEVLENRDGLPESAQEDLEYLLDDSKVEVATTFFRDFAKLVAILPDSYTSSLLRMNMPIIFEPSQGVLLDRWYGFHPFTTKIETTNQAALDLLAENNYQGEIVRLGVIRAYQTRHGAGPFVSESSTLSRLVPDLHNSSDHPWQGNFRVGQLDTVATRYAIDVCGGPSAFNGLVVTCLDRLDDMPSWNIVDRYRPNWQDMQHEEWDPCFRWTSGFARDIVVSRAGRTEEQLAYQENLSAALESCIPVSRYNVRGNKQAYLQEIEERLKVPVALASYGPGDYNDKKELRPI